MNATLNIPLINVVHLNYYRANLPPTLIGLFGELIVGRVRSTNALCSS
jgi:hypothetical protein